MKLMECNLEISGYMAPEYAMEGQFSEKSDVFAFGVLLLELISGRRNTSFYSDEQFSNLLGYVSPLVSLRNLILHCSRVFGHICLD